MYSAMPEDSDTGMIFLLWIIVWVGVKRAFAHFKRSEETLLRPSSRSTDTTADKPRHCGSVLSANTGLETTNTRLYGRSGFNILLFSMSAEILPISSL